MRTASNLFRATAESTLAALQVFCNLLTELAAYGEIALRRAVGCIPGCFQANGDCVVVAVIRDPLATDLAPKWMVAFSRDAWGWFDGQRSADVLVGNFEKQRPIIAAQITQ